MMASPSGLLLMGLAALNLNLLSGPWTQRESGADGSRLKVHTNNREKVSLYAPSKEMT